MTKEEKQKKVQEARTKIDKNIGAGTVIKLSDRPAADTEVISTGSLGLDLALGVGGFPKGRIIEIYGPESSGKTTLAIHAMAECQKAGGIAMIVDAEHAFDSAYAQALGVNIDDLLICQPSSGDEGLEVADIMIDSGGLDLVVIDSVAALVPKAELEGEMGDSKMGLHARLMSQAMRKMAHKIARTGTVVIFINQLRDKIGVMFGSPETTTGGNALKFYASVRLDVRRSLTAENAVMSGTEKVGNLTKVKVIKNKVAPPFKSCEFDILYGQGIDRAGEVLDLSVDLKVIDKSGSWYSYKGDKIGQGKSAVAELFKSNPDFYKEVETEVLNKING